MKRKGLLGLGLVLLLECAIIGCGTKESGLAEVNSDGETVTGQQSVEDVEKSKSAENTFFENASPKTSALAFYQYDGTEVLRGFMFDSGKTEEILNELTEVDIQTAPDWTPEQISTPVYGFDIGGKDGLSIFGVWSNGYWVAQDGTVYTFDYDFEGLAKAYEWMESDSWETTGILPCVRYLTEHNGKWYPAMLSPAKEKQPPEEIELKLTNQDESILTAEIANNGNDEWAFGEYFSLEVLLDDIWYQVPGTPGNWAFTDIGIILMPEERMEMNYNLTMYGELPAGTYRLVVEDMTAEFEINR